MGKRKQSHPSRSVGHRADTRVFQQRTHLLFHNPLHRHKRVKTVHSTMADTTMSRSGDGDSERNDGNQERAFMIPGVDGRLQFGFPKKIITILRYNETQQQASTLGGISTYIYRMNGPFDPDLTGVGHQPMYWDSYTPIYQNYRVLGSRISVEWAPQNPVTAGQGPWEVGIAGSISSSSLGTTGSARAEMNDAVSDLLGVNGDTATLSLVYSPEKSLGRPAGDDTVGSLVTTIPTQQYFAHVWVRDVYGQASPSIIYHRVMIEYTVEFFGLNIPTQS